MNSKSSRFAAGLLTVMMCLAGGLAGCARSNDGATDPITGAPAPATATPSESATPSPTQATSLPTSASPTAATSSASKAASSAASRTTTTAPSQPATTLPPQPGATGKVDCATVKCVAITFDDGPSSATTPQLLATLRSTNTKATFFMLGQMAKANPAIVADIAGDSRFEIGEHTWSHVNLQTIGAGAVQSEMSRATGTISQAAGRPITLFRPPYGNHNATVDQCAKRLGQAEILWDIDTLDWKYRDPSSVRTRALAGVHAGSIILMHDIHPTTVAAVPNVIADLRAQGYTLVTVTELLGNPQPGTVYTQRA